MKPIVLFASGRGSNVLAIIDFFKEKNTAQVALIVCNNPEAGVLDIAAKHHIPVLMIDRKSIKENDWINTIKSHKPAWIVLAGFLWKIPASLIQEFENKIINLHPALLPAYGGKGMYGMKVHESVIAAQEKESGVTVHFINENYDEGNIIIQARCKIIETDTAASLAQKIHALEHYFLPRTIEFLLQHS